MFVSLTPLFYLSLGSRRMREQKGSNYLTEVRAWKWQWRQRAAMLSNNQSQLTNTTRRLSSNLPILGFLHKAMPKPWKQDNEDSKLWYVSVTWNYSKSRNIDTCNPQVTLKHPHSLLFLAQHDLDHYSLWNFSQTSSQFLPLLWSRYHQNWSVCYSCLTCTTNNLVMGEMMFSPETCYVLWILLI